MREERLPRESVLRGKVGKSLGSEILGRRDVNLGMQEAMMALRGWR